jgi:hypothetical protein
MKASLAVFSNLFFLAVICLIWSLEKVLGGNQLSGINLVVFALCALVLIAWFSLRVSPESTSALFYMLGRAALSGVTEVLPPSAEVGKSTCFKQIASSLWVPVTLNFGLAGWLIYASGGIINSPYAQVPIAMMIVGQGVYEVPPIRLRTDTKVPRLLIFVGGVARLYWYPLILMIGLLTTLVMLQGYLPLVTHPAPTAETVLITMLMLFASMCVTFVTRRTDQTSSLNYPEVDADPRKVEPKISVARMKPPDDEIADTESSGDADIDSEERAQTRPFVPTTNNMVSIRRGLARHSPQRSKRRGWFR